jgi:hypothetical protein
VAVCRKIHEEKTRTRSRTACGTAKAILSYRRKQRPELCAPEHTGALFLDRILDQMSNEKGRAFSSPILLIQRQKHPADSHG